MGDSNVTGSVLSACLAALLALLCLSGSAWGQTTCMDTATLPYGATSLPYGVTITEPVLRTPAEIELDIERRAHPGRMWVCDTVEPSPGGHCVSGHWQPIPTSEQDAAAREAAALAELDAMRRADAWAGK